MNSPITQPSERVMATLLEIQQQINELQKQAALIKKTERSKVITEIKNMMKSYEITIGDLRTPRKKKEAEQ